ncbi:methionyl-tRNA synthetase [Malassezia pachydermatis]
MAWPRVADLVRGARLCARTYATTSKPYYVTTPIYYVNAEPHIGHLHSSIMADVLRRYAKLRYDGWSPLGPRGEGTIEPRLTTGTDEHGMKIQRVAEAQNIEPRALCDRVSERFRVRTHMLTLGTEPSWAH